MKLLLDEPAGSDAGRVGQANAGAYPMRQTGGCSTAERPAREPEDALNEEERIDLARLIRRLQELRGVWYETLDILWEVRSRRLYRQDHPTFDAFCREVLGMGKSNANRAMQTAEIAQRLAANVVKPELEAHVRPLLKLDDPRQQEACFRQAQEDARNAGRRLTAADVSKAVRAAQTPAIAPADAPEAGQSKADIITRLQRALVRGLERQEPAALLAFEEAVARFSQTWWQNQPVPGEDEAKAAGADGTGAGNGRADGHE